MKALLSLCSAAVAGVVFCTAVAAYSQEPSPAGAGKAHSQAGMLLPAASRTAVIVQKFTAGDKMNCPFDLDELRAQIAIALRVKSKNHIDALLEPPPTPRLHSYILQGEVVACRRPSLAKVLTIGVFSYGAVGLQTAVDIHYWLADAQGRRILERRDTVRGKRNGDPDLVPPGATKIAKRLADSRLY